MDDEILVFCSFLEYSVEEDINWNGRITEKRMFYSEICFIDTDLKFLKDEILESLGCKRVGREIVLANNICYES